MQTIKYNQIEYKKLIKDLNDGEVVGFPTETVYGLAIIFNNKDAFDKLYQIKNRSIIKPISMMVNDISVMEEVAYINDLERKIINSFMPGSVTIILKAKENLPYHVTFNYDTVGIRIPSNQTALNILKEINCPLLVTSANISSEPSLTKAIDVYEKFNGKIASLIDEDALSDKASTVIKVVDNDIVVLREGKITKNEIIKVLEEK